MEMEGKQPELDFPKVCCLLVPFTARVSRTCCQLRVPHSGRNVCLHKLREGGEAPLAVDGSPTNNNSEEIGYTHKLDIINLCSMAASSEPFYVRY